MWRFEDSENLLRALIAGSGCGQIFGQDLILREGCGENLREQTASILDLALDCICALALVGYNGFRRAKRGGAGSTEEKLNAPFQLKTQ